MSAQITPSQLLNRYRGKPSQVLPSHKISSQKSESLVAMPDDEKKVMQDDSPSDNINQSVALDLLELAINEVEQESYLSTTQQNTSNFSNQSPLKKPGIDLPSLDQSPVSSARKEVEGVSTASVEQGANVQVIEVEKSPELSPEVEKYLQEVHDDKDQAPKEIAIADEIANLPTQNQFVSEPVIVLPITPEVHQKGKRKSPKYSIRWLVEWSQKIIKMFAGKVVYLEPISKE